MATKKKQKTSAMRMKSKKAQSRDPEKNQEEIQEVLLSSYPFILRRGLWIRTILKTG